MKRTIATLAILVFLAGCTPGATTNQQADKKGSERITVAASFYPLAEFARNVAGDHAEVTTITPAGTDPHEYEPSPRDIATVQEADLFIFNGEGQDPWAERLTRELQEKGVKTMHMTEYFTLMEGMEEDHEEEDHDEHEDEHEEGDDHAHERDPHIWLDPTLAIQEVELIREALVEIDPANAENYEANAAAYIVELETLDSEFRETLASCQKQDIITSHAAFGYMAERYGFNQIAIAGLSPEQEPSPRKLAEIADMAEEKNIRYIFFETLVSPRISETLANEIGAETLLLNPIEGLTQEQITAGENYATVMRGNLTNLATALECEG